MTPKVFYNDNNNNFYVLGVKNERTEAFVTDATIEVTFQDLDGNDLDGPTWPLTLANINAEVAGVEGGNYYVVIPYTMDTDGLESGIAVVDISGSVQAHFEVPIEFRKRTVI